MNARMQKYADLVARGCTCGGADPHTPCSIHTGQSDNRGIRVWVEAGMPQGFPMTDCRCGVCGTDGCLIYPNIEIDDPKRSAEFRPTLICPICSAPASEARLRADAEAFGHVLNDATVFGGCT